MPTLVDREVNALVRTTAPEHRIERELPTIYLLIVAGVLIPVIVAYAFSTGNGWQGIAAILVVVATLLIMARPVVGMYCFVALLYIRPEESFPDIAGMHLTLIVALVALEGMMIKLLLDRTALVRHPINVMIVGFGLAAALPSVSQPGFGATLEDISRLVLLVLLVINLVRTPKEYGAMVTSIIVFTAYLAAYALYLDRAGAVITEGAYTRILAKGIFSDPNDLAATICAGLALTFSRLSNGGWWRRFAYSALAGLMLYAIWLTNSRGGLLALGVVALGFLWQLYRTKPRAAIALAVLMVVAFLAVGHGRMTDYDTSDASANQRFWYWSNGVSLLMASPLFGCGYGQFISRNGGMVAHNSFVQCFAELGLVGYFFWLGLIYYAFRKPGSGRQLARGVDAGVVAQPSALARDRYAVCAGLAGYLTASFWLTHTYNPILFLFVTVALCGCTSSVSGAIDWRPTSREFWKDAALIGIISLGSIAFIYRMALSYR